MLAASRFEVPNEIGLDGDRQHRETVLVAFARANHDLVACDVDVLHAKPRTLEQAETRTVKQDRHQPRHAMDLAQHRENLFARQHDGQVMRALGVHKVIEPGHVLPEHLPVKKQERVERLILGRCATLPSTAREVRKP